MAYEERDDKRSQPSLTQAAFFIGAGALLAGAALALDAVTKAWRRRADPVASEEPTYAAEEPTYAAGSTPEETREPQAYDKVRETMKVTRDMQELAARMAARPAADAAAWTKQNTIRDDDLRRR